MSTPARRRPNFGLLEEQEAVHAKEMVAALSDAEEWRRKALAWRAWAIFGWSACAGALTTLAAIRWLA